MNAEELKALAAVINLATTLVGAGSVLVVRLKAIGAESDAAMQAETTELNQATRDLIAADAAKG